MNQTRLFYDQFGGYFGLTGLAVVVWQAFINPESCLERGSRISARLTLGAFVVIWLACIAEQAQGGLQ